MFKDDNLMKSTCYLCTDGTLWRIYNNKLWQ